MASSRIIAAHVMSAIQLKSELGAGAWSSSVGLQEYADIMVSGGAKAT